MKKITGHTRLTGLLGSPVAHSISPQMHNEAFRQLGLDYVYLAFDVGTDQLKTAVDGLKVMNVRGFNLTMPDKNKILDYVDHISPAVEFCGAANTIVNDNGILTAYTTDGIGYMEAVKEAGHDIIGKKMTLLGAGGAASSVLVQAALDGVKEIDIFSRRSKSFEQMQKIVNQINEKMDCKASIYDIKDETQMKRSIGESVILTNGTNVGMAPDTDNCIITDESVFRPDLIVSDVIYNPRETKLMQIARSHGCQAFNGLYMLLFQGAAAFKLWTGVDMPVSVVKEKYFK